MKNVIDIRLDDTNSGISVYDNRLNIYIRKPRDIPAEDGERVGTKIASIDLQGTVALITNENGLIVKAPKTPCIALAYHDVSVNPYGKTNITAGRLLEAGERRLLLMLDRGAKTMMKSGCKQVYRVFRGEIMKLSFFRPQEDEHDACVIQKVCMLGVK